MPINALGNISFRSMENSNKNSHKVVEQVAHSKENFIFFNNYHLLKAKKAVKKKSYSQTKDMRVSKGFRENILAC